MENKEYNPQYGLSHSQFYQPSIVSQISKSDLGDGLKKLHTDVHLLLRDKAIQTKLGADAMRHSNLKATRETNEQNYKIWQEQQAYNTQMYNTQLADSRDTWQQQTDYVNAYNTPAAMRQRLEDAGFNPYLAMSGGAGVAGNSSSSPSVNSPTYNSPSAPQMQTPNMSFMGDSIQGAINTGLQTYLSLKDMDNKTKDTSSTIGYRDAQTRGLGLQFDRDKFQFSWDKKNAPYQHEMMRNLWQLQNNEVTLSNLTLDDKIKQQKQFTAMQDADLVYKRLNVDTQRILNKWLPAEKGVQYLQMVQQLVNLKDQHKLSMKDLRLKSVQILNVMANTANTKADTKNKEAAYQGIKADSNYSIVEQNIAKKVADSTIAATIAANQFNTEHDNAYGPWGSVAHDFINLSFGGNFGATAPVSFGKKSIGKIGFK